MADEKNKGGVQIEAFSTHRTLKTHNNVNLCQRHELTLKAGAAILFQELASLVFVLCTL